LGLPIVRDGDRVVPAVAGPIQWRAVGLIASGGIYHWELSDGDKVVAVKTSGMTLVTDATHARDWSDIEGLKICARS